MKKEELRKVQFSTFDEVEIKFTTHLGYFHIWGRVEKEIQTQITHEMYCSKIEIVTMGIIEDKNTGEVFKVSPDSITFLNN